MWSGAISFGLVNVPVKMYTAVKKQNVRFHQLHDKDGSRIEQKRVCSKDGKEIPWEEVAKGYEISPGHFVMLEPEELEALDPEATHTIDIEDFVALDEIDPLYFDSSYYLVPDKAGTKAYRLLHKAMGDAERVGIARVVLRTKQYLAAVRPVDDALVLTTMNFADEVMPVKDLAGLPGKGDSVSKKELDMAAKLIDSLTTEFKPGQYKDTYRKEVLDLIEKKADGEEIIAEPSSEKRAPVVDLMAALEASLASGKKASSSAKKSTSKPKARKQTRKSA
jgi:DNA end-binding protein Ku